MRFETNLAQAWAVLSRTVDTIVDTAQQLPENVSLLFAKLTLSDEGLDSWKSIWNALWVWMDEVHSTLLYLVTMETYPDQRRTRSPSKLQKGQNEQLLCCEQLYVPTTFILIGKEHSRWHPNGMSHLLWRWVFFLAEKLQDSLGGSYSLWERSRWTGWIPWEK